MTIDNGSSNVTDDDKRLSKLHQAYTERVARDYADAVMPPEVKGAVMAVLRQIIMDESGTAPATPAETAGGDSSTARPVDWQWAPQLQRAHMPETSALAKNDSWFSIGGFARRVSAAAGHWGGIQRLGIEVAIAAGLMVAVIIGHESMRGYDPTPPIELLGGTSGDVGEATIARLRQLIAECREVEARQLLDEFKDGHPDYQLPAVQWTPCPGQFSP